MQYVQCSSSLCVTTVFLLQRDFLIWDRFLFSFVFLWGTFFDTLVVANECSSFGLCLCIHESVQARVFHALLLAHFDTFNKMANSWSVHLIHLFRHWFFFLFFSETGKLAKSIGYSLVRTPRAYHPISKIKPLSTKPKEHESKGILQTPFGSVETFEVCCWLPWYVAISSLEN